MCTAFVMIWKMIINHSITDVFSFFFFNDWLIDSKIQFFFNSQSPV